MLAMNQLTDDQLLLYSRQIMLPQIDIIGQQKLLQASVLVLGAGGLGCPVSLYLAASGIGKLIIVDHDTIELSNVQRQILFGTGDVGRSKTSVAREKINSLYSHCEVEIVDVLPDEARLTKLMENVDVVIDGTDNFESRYRHNLICARTGTPLISGAVIRFEGQITVFDHSDAAAPCYYCLYKDAQDERQNCADNGVLGSVAGMVATVMATEAIKILVKIGDSLSGRLLLLDALAMEWRSVRLQQDPSCPVCKLKQI